MIFIFLSVACVCVTGLVAQHRALSKDRWVTKEDYEFLKQECTLAQKGVATLQDKLKSLETRVNLGATPSRKPAA